MTESAAQTIRVLLAEDDDNARTLLVDLLNTLGHVVVAEVATGREAYTQSGSVPGKSQGLPYRAAAVGLTYWLHGSSVRRRNGAPPL